MLAMTGTQRVRVPAAEGLVGVLRQKYLNGTYLPGLLIFLSIGSFSPEGVHVEVWRRAPGAERGRPRLPTTRNGRLPPPNFFAVQSTDVHGENPIDPQNTRAPNERHRP